MNQVSENNNVTGDNIELNVDEVKKKQLKKHYDPDNIDKTRSPEEVEARKRNATDGP